MVPSNRSYWSPEYWRNLDRLVYQANEKGLVVVLTGVLDPFGLASPYAAQSELEIFAHNLAARMAGFFVIYSVGWDNRAETATYRCGGDGNGFVVNGVNQSVINGFTANAEVVALMKAVGTELNKVTGQLITTHLGGGTPFFGGDNYFHDPGANGQSQPLASAYSYFHREPWLDFHLFQSSQCNPERASVFQHQGTGNPGVKCASFVAEPDLVCVMRRARTMPAKFLSLRVDDSLIAGSPLVKPVVDGEARYERTVPAGQQQPVADIAYQSRHAGHVTTLSGVFGFTGGVFNVGEWRWPGDGMGITGPQAGKSPGQLKFLSLFQEGQVMEWERLRRKELMLKNPGTDENERSVVAASESNQYIVAYLPERKPPSGQQSADRTLQLAIHQGIYAGFDTCRWSKLWWNPFNGESRPVKASEITRLTRTCVNGESPPCLTFSFGAPQCVGPDARPDSCDWVLLLDDLLACPSSSAGTQIWSGLDPDTGLWGLYAQKKGPAGEPTGEIASVAGLVNNNEVQASPKIANGQAQGALAVWTAEGVDGDGFGILARKLDAEGLPTGPLLAVNAQGDGDQVEPSVAPVGETGYIVTWTSYSEEGDQGEVYARYLDNEGNPVGDEFRVNVTTAGRQAASQVASDSQGNVLMAWESWGQDGDGNGVFARRFGPSGSDSEEFQVYQAGAGWQYLTSVQPDAAGTFEVHWQVFTQHGTDLGSYGQRISPQGVPRIGEEFGLAAAEGGVGN